MKIGVSGKIDVTKIIREAMFKGQKGTYLDFKVFIDVDVQDQYGNNGMVTQEFSKEARDRNEQGPILGNVKVFWNDTTVGAPQQQAPQQQQGGYQQSPPQQQQAPQQQQGGYQAPQSSDFDDDIPF